MRTEHRLLRIWAPGLAAALVVSSALVSTAPAEAVSPPPPLTPGLPAAPVDFDKAYHTFVAVPDTQGLVTSDKSAQIGAWIAANKTNENIKGVIALGDMVGASESEAQWANAKALYGVASTSGSVYNSGIPVSFIPGNHDYYEQAANGDGTGNMPSRSLYGNTNPTNPAVNCNKVDNVNYFNYFNCFGEGSIWAHHSAAGSTGLVYSWNGTDEFGYDGSSDDESPTDRTDNGANSYQRITVGNATYMILGLEAVPRRSVITWANRLLNRFPTDKVILATHQFASGADGQVLRDDANLLLIPPTASSPLASTCRPVSWPAGARCLDAAYAAQAKNPAITIKDADPKHPDQFKFVYGVPPGAAYSSGETLYNDLVSKHDNIFLVLSGHSGSSDRAIVTPLRNGLGSLVYSVIADSQNIETKDNPLGMVVLIRVADRSDKMQIVYYSTVWDAHGVVQMSDADIAKYNASGPCATPPAGTALATRACLVVGRPQAFVSAVAANSVVWATDDRGLLWGMSYDTQTGVLTKPSLVGYGWAGWRIFSPGDMNKDGKADLLGISAAGDLYVYAGDGKGGVTTKTAIGSAWSTRTLITPGGLTDDNFPYLLGIDSAGDLYLYKGNGAGGLAPGPYTKVGSGWKGWQAMPAGDVDGDGKADLLGLDPSGRLFFYPGLGSGSKWFGSRIQVTTRLLARAQGAGNLDKQGADNLDKREAAEILGIAPDGTLWKYTWTGTAFVEEKSGSGWSSYILVSGSDITGDGWGDILGIVTAATPAQYGEMYFLAGTGMTGLGTFGVKTRVKP